MTFHYNGIFINLNRSKDRRGYIEGELKKAGLRDRYTRLSAVDGNGLEQKAGIVRPEQEACFRSHYEALTLGRQFGGPVHIIEDDIMFARQFEPAVRSIHSGFNQFDIIFTNTFVDAVPLLLRDLKHLFDRCVKKHPNALTFCVIDVTSWYRASMSSYFVMQRGIETLYAAFARGLAAGPTRPIDLFLRDEARAGRLRLGCIFPFITTTFHTDYSLPSTIQNDEPLWSAVFSTLGYSFFVGRDISRVPTALVAKLWPSTDEHTKLISGVLNFVVSSPEYPGNSALFDHIGQQSNAPFVASNRSG
jgi:GR25 family glycosyltransferase involved in LPS biosynthesis